MTKYFKITNLEELKTRLFCFKYIKRRDKKVEEKNTNGK